MMKLFTQLSENVNGRGKSSILAPLLWGIGIITGAIVALCANFPRQNAWVVICIVFALLSLLVALIVVSIRVYLKQLERDPDSLRSEGYGLTKFAIQNGLVGDSVFGTRKLTASEELGDVIDSKVAEKMISAAGTSEDSKKELEDKKS